MIVTVVQLTTKEQTRRVGDMKRLEISLLCYFSIAIEI